MPARRIDRARRRPVILLALGLLLAPAAACTDDDGGSGQGGGTEDTVAPDREGDLLGPDDPASGEPVRIGFVSDGTTPAYDNTDEIRAAEASVAYHNQHRGGVAGRPVELVTCETGGDPGAATDCANRLVAEGVVAVAVAQSAVLENLWEPLHDSGVPTFILSTGGSEIEQDPESTFIVYNSLTALALPIATAQDVGADRIAFAVIDVPQATQVLEGPGLPMLESAGLGFDAIRIPIGTADMVPQMQQVVDTGDGVVEVVGNDAFCIAAFQGLATAGYDGEVTAVSQCMTDATREAMPGGLEGIHVVSNFATGATDDPTYQLYLAVMAAYAEDLTDVDNATSLGGYGTIGALIGALAGMEGDITPGTAIEALKSMEPTEVPAAAGVTFRCGGSAVPESPAICTNQWLRTQTDAEGNPTTYTLEDSSELFP